MDFETFHPQFCAVLSQNGQERYANEAISRRFHRLTEHMLEVNKSMNLTAIRDERDVMVRHFADCLTIDALLPQGARVLDVGCGAGFPCLPLAICRPDLELTALDSTEKRIRYVRETAALLECQNLTALAARAEEQGNGPLREQFDACTARAVADLPVLAELCLPFVKVGGVFLAMKGARGDEELERAQGAIRKLGGTPEEVRRITLRSPFDPSICDTRTLIVTRKQQPTPREFPRAFARIVKKPL